METPSLHRATFIHPQNPARAGVAGEVARTSHEIQSGIPGTRLTPSIGGAPLDQVRKWRVTITVRADGELIRLPNGKPKVYKRDIRGTKREVMEERDRRSRRVQEGHTPGPTFGVTLPRSG